MAKVLNTYRGYTASDINSRASNTCTHSVVGSTVECTDVMMSKVKNVLGASTYSLYDLCRNNSVNIYSGFGPTVLSYYAGGGTLDASLLFTKPTACSLGSFAGYNHSAITPALDHIYYDSNVTTGNMATFDAYVNIGEMRYPSPAAALVLSLWDGGTMISTGFTALSGVKDTNIFVTADSCTLTSNKTLTCRLHIGDSTTEFQQNGANALCVVPNTTVTGYDRAIVIGPAGGAVTYQNATDWGVWTWGNVSKPSTVTAFEGSTGYIDLKVNGTYTNTNQQISANVTGTGVSYGSMDIFRSSRDGDYNANTTLYFSQYVGAQMYNDWQMTITFGDEF